MEPPFVDLVIQPCQSLLLKIKSTHLNATGARANKESGDLTNRSVRLQLNSPSINHHWQSSWATFQVDYEASFTTHSTRCSSMTASISLWLVRGFQEDSNSAWPASITQNKVCLSLAVLVITWLRSLEAFLISGNRE